MAEEVIARSHVDLLMALVLTYEGLWSHALGDLIPQAVWERAHSEELVQAGRDFTGEGTLFVTAKGLELLTTELKRGR